MGRSDIDASQHHQGFDFEQIHQAPDPRPPPQLQKDLYEPPAGYKTPNNNQPVHAFTPPGPDGVEPQSHVHVFPPPQAQQPPTQKDNTQDQNLPPQHNNVNNILQQQLAKALATQQNQEWKTSLFGCLDNPQNAFITLFCPCVTFGQIAEVLDNGSTSCAASGTWYTMIACCFGMPCLLSCGYRSKLRAKFGLMESTAPDCLIHCFCDYCALCQEYRELNARGFDPSIGHAGIVARQRQQALQQLGMIPPLQQKMMN